jgi:hypothetical protein
MTKIFFTDGLKVFLSLYSSFIILSSSVSASYLYTESEISGWSLSPATALQPGILENEQSPRYHLERLGCEEEPG